MADTYYAIHRGRCEPQVLGPNVCWYHDVLPLVHKYPNARFKKFKTLAEAACFAETGCEGRCF